MRYTNLALIITLLFSCDSSNKTEIKQEQPNILWIVTEDISPTLSFYGDYTAKTPHLDALSSESLIYDNVFAPVGVCAPSRSSIITGMYPTTIGTMHMRTGKDVFSWGTRTYKDSIPISDINQNPIREYSAVIPDYVKCFPEYLIANGYFCSNNAKTDYQFAAPVTAWNQNGNNAHWRNKPEGKPFFSVFNFGSTHESRLWHNDTLPLTVDPKDVKVPPYLPDNNATRKTIARHYSNVELMDKQVGELIAQLKEDELYDSTIIFFYSDHGGPLPRQKREIYDSGLKVPFMIKDISSKQKGRTDRMVSFVDLAPTMLSLANLEPPKYMEGQVFLGKHEDEAREYVYGSSDRFDEFTDRIRSVRNKQYLYLNNSFPELPKYKDVGYRKNVPMMPVFLDLKEKDKIDSIQKIWFGNKTSEELYDCNADPHNINNLAEDPKYTTVLSKMRTALDIHMKGRQDLGEVPEAELINTMWPNFEQPVTQDVSLSAVETSQGKSVTLSSKTKGASIAYIISDKPNEKFDFNSDWQLYSKPFLVDKGKFIYTIGQRIGFKESSIIQQEKL